MAKYSRRASNKLKTTINSRGFLSAVSKGNMMKPDLKSKFEIDTRRLVLDLDVLEHNYYLIRGDEAVGSWPIDLRGCSQ